MDYKQYGGYDFTPKIKGGQDLPEGEMGSWSQLTVSANVNLIKRNRWMLQASGLYRFVSAEDQTAKPASGRQGYLDGEYHFHSEGLNLTYFSKLFGKTAIYSAGIFADGSDESYERIRGMATGMVLLKANAKTRMSVGLMVTTDPGSLAPVLPIFLYEHKFSEKLKVDVMLPRYAYLRREMFTNGRLSLGWDFDQTTLFLYGIEGRSNTYQYSQIDANVGLLYEQALPGNLILSAKAGVRVNPFIRVFDVDESFNDYNWSVSTDPAPYVSVGISYNPFSKPKK